MKQWSQDLLERLEDEDFNHLPLIAINERWLGCPGATNAEIAAAEARLGITFPPSYKDFLRVSNGLQEVSRFIINPLPIQQVDWLSTREPDLYDAWMEQGDPSIPKREYVPDEEYFVYGDEQSCEFIRDEYLQTALEIGVDEDNDSLLLNPQIIFEDKEWEAWLFAAWMAGAIRCKSFRELMQEEHRTILETYSQLRELP